MENANRKEMKKNNTKRILQKYNEKYKKVGVLPLYGIRSNILSEVHSSEKNMNLRYFLSSPIFCRNVRPHTCISNIGNRHAPF